MNNDFLTELIRSGGLLITGFVASLLAFKGQRRSDKVADNQFSTTHSLEQIKNLQSRNDHLEKELDAVREENRKLEEFVTVLRIHIIKETGPPPPEL